jgi:hypothetical protein
MNPLTLQQHSDQMGRRLARRLNDAARDIPLDISERIRFGREQALQRCKVSEISRNQSGSLILQGLNSDPLWTRWVSLLALAALLLGLMAVDQFSDDFQVQDLAEIDAAILTDDLPPHAYSDPGFAHFLKTKLETSNAPN